jgi:hypothetical protein
MAAFEKDIHWVFEPYQNMHTEELCEEKSLKSLKSWPLQGFKVSSNFFAGGRFFWRPLYLHLGFLKILYFKTLVSW